MTPFQKWREGVGAPPRPAQVLLPWSCGGARSRGVSGGRAGETVTKCFASPRTLGEGGAWCGHLGGAQPHFLSLPPLATLLSVLALDFTAPDPELIPRDLRDGVYGLSSPKAGLLERGLWLTSHGSKTGPPDRSPDICCQEGKRERGRKGKGGSKGWRHGVRRDLLLVQRLRLYAPHTGGPGSIPGWGATSHMHVATEFSRHNREARMPQIRPSAA